MPSYITEVLDEFEQKFFVSSREIPVKEYVRLNEWLETTLHSIVEEVRREFAEYINRGQFSTKEMPCEAWEKLNLRDKSEIVWHILQHVSSPQTDVNSK